MRPISVISVRPGVREYRFDRDRVRAVVAAAMARKIAMSSDETLEIFAILARFIRQDAHAVLEGGYITHRPHVAQAMRILHRHGWFEITFSDSGETTGHFTETAKTLLQKL